ncbi:hypothetical protein VTI74DRAFT_6547 [Chaetomium olivicolor]
MGRQRGRTSTIDHFWTSKDLQAVYYGERCRGKSDHYLQVLEIGEGERPRPAQPAGWAWKKMDKKRTWARTGWWPGSGPRRASAKAWSLAKLGRRGKHFPEEGELRLQLSLVDYGGGTSRSGGKESRKTGQGGPRRLLLEELNERLKELARTTHEARTRAWGSGLQAAARRKS